MLTDRLYAQGRPVFEKMVPSFGKGNTGATRGLLISPLKKGFRPAYNGQSTALDAGTRSIPPISEAAERRIIMATHGHAPTSWGIIGPRIRLRGEALIVKTSLAARTLSLFSYCRTVIVSGPKKQVEIRARHFWKEHAVELIPFENIGYVDLIYPPVPVNENQHEDPIHTLFLVTRNPTRRVDLFKLRCTEFSSSPNLAVRCAAMIAEIMGKRIGVHDRVKFPENGFQDTYRCNGCGQRLSSATDKLHCPYCGGNDIRIE